MASLVVFLCQQGNMFLIPLSTTYQQEVASSTPFFILLFSFALIIVIRLFLMPTTSQKNLPPSPKRLPIIGNLHQLGIPLHHTLYSLSKKYGPVMQLRLGRIPVLVISSAEAAEEVMKTQDLTFSSRRNFKINKKLLYDSKDVAAAPYGEYWRQMKSIFVLRLLSNKRVRSFRSVREDRTLELMKKIERSSHQELNVSKLLGSLTLDMVREVALGKTKEVEGDKGERFKKLLDELMRIVGGFDLGEVIPWLAWVSRVSGKDSQVDRVAKGIDEVLEEVVQGHMDRDRDGTKKHFDDEDFVDILLNFQKEEGSGISIDRDGVKALLLDAFAGGSDTTSTLLEWEMSELLKHPTIMKRLQEEIRCICKGKTNVTEEDLEKMNYLKAVVKETLRLHPPFPMPVPREAREDTKVMGYDIEAETMVIVNLWAIGRDPKYWENPHEFRPERFIDSSVDFKGNHFQFIPFGAGRRGCPGISFAAAVNEIVLANLVNKFDWKLPNEMAVEDLDMTESGDFTIHRKIPLIAIAIPHSFE